MLNAKQKKYLKIEYEYLNDMSEKYYREGNHEKGNEFAKKQSHLHEFIDCLLEAQGEKIEEADWLWE